MTKSAGQVREVTASEDAADVDAARCVVVQCSMRYRALLSAVVLQLLLSTSLPAQLVLRGRAQEVSTDVAFRVPIVIDSVALDSSTKANEGRQIQMDRRSRGPEYPVDMLAEGRDGRVILMYSILADGRVDRRSAFPLVSSHESFLSAVFRALPTFRYPKSVVPAGRPCYLVAQPFVFTLYR